MKKRVVLAALMAALLLMGALSAYAASLIFSPRADAALLADEALETEYGVTREMLTFFRRIPESQEDGSFRITYRGMDVFEHVLGTYTAQVKDGNVQVSWSHDEKENIGGFDSPVWGKEQLEEMLRLCKEEHEFNILHDKAAAQKAPMVTPGPDAAKTSEDDWNAQQEALKMQSALSEDEMTALSLSAISEIFGLTQEQTALLTLNPYMSYYFTEGAQLYYHVHLDLLQQPSEDPSAYPEFIQGDGAYWVTVNTASGVIEDILYDSALAGNG